MKCKRTRCDTTLLHYIIIITTEYNLMYYNDWYFGFKGKRNLEVVEHKSSLCNSCIMIAFIISAKKLETLDVGSFLKFKVLRKVLRSLMQYFINEYFYKENVTKFYKTNNNILFVFITIFIRSLNLLITLIDRINNLLAMPTRIVD